MVRVVQIGKGFNVQNNDKLKESAIVAVNEAGRVVGQDHPNATLSDKDIDRMHEIHPLTPDRYL